MSGKKQKDKTNSGPCKIQLIYEKILGYGAWALAAWHLLLSVGRYVIDYYVTVRPYECWYALILLFAAILYPVLCRILWPETTWRIKAFFRKFRTPGQFFCLGLFVWYILSCLLNTLFYSLRFFAHNDWYLLDTVINCIILYNLPMVLSMDRAKKMTDLMLHIVSLLGTVFAVYGLYCLFTLNVVTLPSGGQIGMAINYTFDLGCLYNISAAIALSFILIAFYMIATQNTLLRILYGFVLCVHTAVLLLSNARASYVAGLAAYAIALFLILWNSLRQKPLLTRLISGIAASTAAAAVLWILRPAAFQLFESVTHFSELFPKISKTIPEVLSFRDPGKAVRSLILFTFPDPASRKNMKKTALSLGIALGLVCAVWFVQTAGSMSFSEQAAAQAETETAEPKPLVNIDEAVRPISTLNNRAPVWISALNVMSSSPQRFIFGVTPAGVMQALYAIGGLYFEAAHAHNEILQIGTSLGVPMMVVFMIFLAMMGYKSVRLGLLEGDRYFHGSYIIPVVFAALFILNLVEAFLFAYFSIMSCLFFLFCGWIDALTVK